MSGQANREAREKLLDSAIKTFARKGFTGASVQDILQATGLSKPTLYYYFDSKAGLFQAIVDSAYDESMRRMQERVAECRDTRERLIGLATAMFEFAAEKPELLRLVFGTAFSGAEEIPAESLALEKRRRHFEYVMGVIELGVQNGELTAEATVTELTHGIYGAVSHKTRMHLLCGGEKLTRQTAIRVVDLFLAGAQAK